MREKVAKLLVGYLWNAYESGVEKAWGRTSPTGREKALRFADQILALSTPTERIAVVRKDEMLTCPFCEDSDFDRIGLWSHIHDCEEFKEAGNEAVREVR